MNSMAGSARTAGNLKGAACIDISSASDAADIYHKAGRKEGSAMAVWNGARNAGIACDWRERRAKLDRNEGSAMAATKDGDRDAESRRILDRVAREQHSGLGLFDRGTERVREHLAADDADQNDWIEVWGTRIGRSLGVIVIAAFLVWLVKYLASGA
jgi:hypothetical protein